MTNQEATNILLDVFPEKIINHSEPFGMLTVDIAAKDLVDFVTWLKDDTRFQCTFMTDLCGVHYPDRKGSELEVVYLFHNWAQNFRIRVKVGVPISHPHVPTICHLYKAANWMERETFDFYGIRFDGHPDLRRIMNVDDMNYHPQRKEYQLEDGTRTDKDDRFFGRDGHVGVQFDKHGK